MKNTPRKIYLNVGDYPGDDFRELAEVTWCSNKQFEEDIEYVRMKRVDEALNHLLANFVPLDDSENAIREFREIMEGS